jgi:glycosyltransferase involved in cell wall biosynthesis
MGPRITYAVSTHNEGDSVQFLIDRINKCKDSTDELVILDDYSTDPTTLSALSSEKKVYKKKFNNDYAIHKNYLNSLCTGDYIFQFDGDELPAEFLLNNTKRIILGSPSTDLFWVPRDNQLIELDMEYIKKWKWRVDELGRINYPDYQGRLYRNSPEIRWHRSVHELITGWKKQTVLPKNSKIDILHKRHMNKQIKNQKFYDETF